MQLKKGSEVEVHIDRFADQGKSIAMVEGYVVFVPHGIPGDRVRIAITRRRKKFAEGRIIEILEPSVMRTDPVCRYFGTCGGCKWQNLAYEHQLEAKHQTVVGALEHHGGFTGLDIPGVLGAEDPYHYRNKMEFSFSAGRWLTDWEIASGEHFDKDFALGLHAPGRFDKVLDIKSCDLVPRVVMPIVNSIRDLARSEDWNAWHIRKHRGYLRHLVVRIGHRTDQIMLNLVTSARLEDRMMKMAAMLQNRHPEVTTFLNTIHSGPAQVAIGEEVDIIFGPGFIEERMGRFTFEIGPHTFFQTNTSQAEELYRIALEFADLKPDDHVYDLYCGCGTISLFASAKAGKVTGIELIPEAVEAAERNASRNGVSNCEFIAGDMLETFKDEFVNDHGRPDVVIVDPPRAGLHPKVAKRLARLAAPRLVYVSCNPLSQARDLATLNSYYEVRWVQPVDLFPQTHHIENVVLLVHREGS